MFGFLRKRSNGAIKFFINRWFFLVSSRPLNQEDYLRDNEVLQDAVLPPTLDFDVLYSFFMGNEKDSSGAEKQIKVSDIISITVKNMATSGEEGHAFIIDTGKTRYHLNSIYKFEMESWVEALTIAV
jgi:hypothetical protein